MAFPFVPVGLGAAAILGISLLLMKSSGAKPAEPAKNAAENKALGTEYASGKTAGYAQGGLDSSTTGVEDLNPDSSPGAIEASKKTGDPAMFLKGFKDGYLAGFSAAEAAKKIGAYAISTTDEAPPPPPAPPATPPGKPATYVANPNTTGYNTGFGSGVSYGKGDETDYAPGSSGANGLKSADAISARKKFDEAQMTLWSSSWDKGYQDGWDTGQAKLHSEGGFATDTTTRGSGEASVAVGLLIAIKNARQPGSWGVRNTMLADARRVRRAKVETGAMALPTGRAGRPAPRVDRTSYEPLAAHRRYL